MRYLPEALESVLLQTFRSFEVVVLEGGSTDGSGRYVREVASRDSRVRVLFDGGAGFVPALNLGLAEAGGELIARMDADDISDPTRFERQVRFLMANSDIAIVGGGAVVIDDVGHEGRRLSPPINHSGIVNALARGTLSLIHPAVMFRRSAVLGCGGYRVAWPAAEDWDLWLRLTERHKAANLSCIVLKLRKHSGNLSMTRLSEQTRCIVMALALAEVRRLGYEDVAETTSELFSAATNLADRLIHEGGIVAGFAARSRLRSTIAAVGTRGPWWWTGAEWECFHMRSLFVRQRIRRAAHGVASWLIERMAERREM